MKRTFKKFLSLMLVLLMVCAIPLAGIGSGITAEAAESGSCGENVTWEFDSSSGTLTISGTGDMDNWYGTESFGIAPWTSFRSQIKHIVVSDGVTSIGDYSFFREAKTREEIFDIKDSVVSVTLPNSIKYIGRYAFTYCNSLTEIVLPNELTEIGEVAFVGCTGIKTIEIPASVTVVDELAFSYMTGLEEVKISSEFSSNGLFAGATNLKRVTLEEGVITISPDEFAACTSLETIILPQSLQYIQNSAFASSYALSDIYYAGTEEDWAQIEIEPNNDPIYSATIHYNFTFVDKDDLNLPSVPDTTAMQESADSNSSTLWWVWLLIGLGVGGLGLVFVVIIVVVIVVIVKKKKKEQQ